MITSSRAVHRGLLAVVALAAGTGAAQAQITRVDSGKQAVGFTVGYFSVKGFDSRVDGDVLVADLSQGAYSLAFDPKDFNGAQIGGEWLFGVGDYLEVGAGVGFYQRTVPSVYEQKIRDDGSELAQDLKLRVIPLSATVRFLPLGRGGVEPYVGAGVGAFSWRYSEAGEFIDERTDITFRDRFVAKGTAPGAIILGGVRVPVADIWTVGGELRYQKVEGDIDPDAGMLGDRIDLGGWTTSFTLHLRF